MKDAYLDANRAIFMQEYFITKGYEPLLHSWETSQRHPLSSPMAAALGRVLLPIVKVPTHALETAGSCVLGAPGATIELAGLLHRGLDTMKPEEAEAFMHHLKKAAWGPP